MKRVIDWTSVFYNKEIMRALVPLLAFRERLVIAALTCRTLRERLYPIERKQLMAKQKGLSCDPLDGVYCLSAHNECAQCTIKRRERDWAPIFDWKRSIMDQFKPSLEILGADKEEWPIVFVRDMMRTCMEFPLLSSSKDNEEDNVVLCFGGCGKFISKPWLMKRKFCRYNICVHCFRDNHKHIGFVGDHDAAVAYTESLLARLSAFLMKWENVLTSSELSRLLTYVTNYKHKMPNPLIDDSVSDMLRKNHSVCAGSKSLPLVDAHICAHEQDYIPGGASSSSNGLIFFNAEFVAGLVQFSFETFERRLKMAFSDAIFKSIDIPIPKRPHKKLKPSSILLLEDSPQ
jgi:hypothetical protein